MIPVFSYGSAYTSSSRACLSSISLSFLASGPSSLQLSKSSEDAADKALTMGSEEGSALLSVCDIASDAASKAELRDVSEIPAVGLAVSQDARASKSIAEIQNAQNLLFPTFKSLLAKRRSIIEVSHTKENVART